MDLSAFFSPRTMAVVGVSSGNFQHPANVVFAKNRHRYPVEVFPVSPRGGTLQGREVFERVGDIPERIDLAVIAVKADAVPDVLVDCAAAGVGGAAVISGGFTEVGRQDLQDRLAAIAREASMPLIGPNCLGIYVPSRVDTFFLPSERMVKPRRGNVTFVSQSGGILVDVMIRFAQEGVGLARAVSIGNKAVLGEADLLPFLVEDPETRVIAFYIEGFGRDEGRRFVRAARQCGKPVVVLKSGRSPEGSRAVSSHTASLAGDYASFSAALAQYGLLEASTKSELVSFCEVLSAYPRPAVMGNVAIITASGGHGAMAMDACSSYGIPVPTLSGPAQEKIRAALSERVAGIASLGNPVDLTGSAVDDDFAACADALFAMGEVDCVVALLLPYIPGITSDLGSKMSTVASRHGKPLVAYVPQVDKYDMLIEGFELNGVPVSPSIEGAVRMAEGLRRCRRC